MRFQHLEELGKSDSISILATQRALDQAGQPTINHDNLQQLMEEDLRLPDYRIKLYDGSQLGVAPKPFDLWRSGYPTLWNKTLHVPVTNMSSPNPMTRLIASGLVARTKQERKFPPRYWGTELTAASVGSLAVGEIASVETASVAGLVGLAVTGLLKSLGDQQTPLERFRLETRELRQDHERDIVFQNHSDARYLNPAK